MRCPSAAPWIARPKPHSHQYPGPRTPVAANPKPYNPRHPEQTLLYRTVAENFETWLELASAGQFDGQGDHPTPPAYVEQAFRKYLECGIFAHGFDEAAVAQAQAAARTRILRAFVGRGLIESFDAKEMLAYQYSGFSVDAGEPIWC